MPYNTIGEYVDTVCEQIRCKKTHTEIAKELTDHIEDQKSEYLAEGCDEHAAEEKAIESMGDAVTVGQQLDRTHRPKTQWGVLVSVLVLLIMGMIIQYILQINNVESSRNIIFNSNIFLHYVTWLPLGVTALFLGYFVDYTILGKYPKLIYIAFTVLLLLLTFYFDRFVHWGRIPCISWVVLLYSPAYAALIYSLRGRSYGGVLLCGIAYLVPFSICLIIPNSSLLFMLSLTLLIVLTVAIAKGWFGGRRWVCVTMVYGILAVTALLVWGYLGSVYSRERFIAMVRPEQFPLEDGWLAILVRKVLAGAQFFGASSTVDSQQMGKELPAWWSDYMLAFLMGRYGYFIGIAVAIVLTVLFISMLHAAFSLKNRLGFLVAFSCTVMLMMECIQYFLVNTGILNCGSMGLPLLSYGGTGLCVHLFLIGLMLSTYRNDDLVWEHDPKQKPAQGRLFTVQSGKLIIDFAGRNK